MIYIFISWMIIGISAFLWGFSILSVIGRFNNHQDKDLDLVIMAGMCALSVYAQFFSLFYKVDFLALMGVFLLDVICLPFIYRGLISWMKEKKRLFFSWRPLAAAGAGVAVLIVATGNMQIYDTGLYHAQTVRWIEEYGVVPGLGNLHGRLAFNSAFHCLQALFSFRSIIGQSMHSLNGFMIWIILSYALCSVRFLRGEIYVSDFLRVGLIVYYERMTYYVASPTPDTYTMMLIGYIICKWVTLLEENEKRIAPYAYLCILGVYTISVKLSSAMLIWFVIMPAFWLVRERKWKEILLYIGLGILTVIPFLIRNIIISGYLVYPYPEIDLFSFDWKIPAEEVESMRTAITAWAQGFRHELEIVSFNEWFPVWKEMHLYKNPVLFREFTVNLIAIPVSIIAGVKRGIGKGDWNFLHVAACLVAGVLFWFFNAPDPRFGEIYLLFLPLYLIGYIIKNIRFKNMAVRAVVTAVIVITGCLWIYNARNYTVGKIGWADLVICPGYDYFECQPTDFEGVTVYYPTNTDLTGYHCFPSVPDVNILSKIELRGHSLTEGFRPKDS